MDEVDAGQTDAAARLAELELQLAITERNQQVFIRSEAVYLDGLRVSIEFDLRWLRRHKWIMRGLGLCNVANAYWFLSSWPRWSSWVSPIAVWGAWHAFKSAEGVAADIAPLEVRWAEVRERIKTIERMAASES